MMSASIWKTPLTAEDGLRAYGLRMDAYYNTVADKIIAYPKGQQFRWTMLNLGRVHIWGADVLLSTTLQPGARLVGDPPCAVHLATGARRDLSLQDLLSPSDSLRPVP